MARTKSAEVRALWGDRLWRCESSDLTVAAFCDWEGVSPAAFYVWWAPPIPVTLELATLELALISARER